MQRPTIFQLPGARSIKGAVILLASLLAVTAMAQTTAPAPTTPDPQVVWRDALRALAKREGVTLFMDVNLRQDAPGDFGVPLGRALITLMEATWRRRHVDVDGVQVFARRAPGLTRTSQLTNWLAGLSADEARRLVEGSLRTGDIDPATAFRIVSECRLPGTLGPAFMQNPEGSLLQLAVEPVLRSRHPETGLRFIARPNIRTGGGRSRPDPVITGAWMPRDPLPKGPTGPLDFGEGDVYSLSELLRKAQAAFGVRYVMDERLAESTYFVNGQFTREAFDRALAELTLAPEARAVDTSVESDRHAAVDRLLDGPIGDALRDADMVRSDYAIDDPNRADRWTAAGLAKGFSVTVAELMEISPSTAAYLQREGFTPSCRFDVSLGLRVTVDTGIVDWDPVEPGQPRLGVRRSGATFVP